MRLIFIALAWLMHWNVCLGQENSIAQSALAQVRINSLAWEAFDVLIEQESFTDKGDAGVVEATIFHRIIFDSRHEVGAYFKRGEATIFEAGDQPNDAQQKGRQSAMGGVSVGGATLYRTFPNPISKFNEPDFTTLFRKLESPDVRLFGQTFIQESQNWNGESADNVARFQAGANQYQAVGNTIVVGATLPSHIKGLVKALRWTLASSTGMPTELRISTRVLDTNVEYPGAVEMYEWGEVEGIFVPTSVYCQVRQIRSKNGKRESYLDLTDYHIHWIALNPREPLTVPRDALDDLQKFREATDPEALKKRFIAGKLESR